MQSIDVIEGLFHNSLWDDLAELSRRVHSHAEALSRHSCLRFRLLASPATSHRSEENFRASSYWLAEALIVSFNELERLGKIVAAARRQLHAIALSRVVVVSESELAVVEEKLEYFHRELELLQTLETNTAKSLDFIRNYPVRYD